MNGQLASTWPTEMDNLPTAAGRRGKKISIVDDVDAKPEFRASEHPGAVQIPAIRPGTPPLGAALAYGQSGLYVVPTDPDEIKNPGSVLGARWPEQSTRDPKLIEQWWTDNPDYGIAFHVGRSGAVVFDLDRSDAADVPAEILSALRLGRIQLTRTDNDVRGHYVFAAAPGEFGNSAGGFSPYGEVRGRNGVIIVQPSPHPESDGWYRWQSTGPLEPLPDVLRDLLRRTPGSRGRERVIRSTTNDSRENIDALTDSEFAVFLSEYTSEHRPEALNGPINDFHRAIDAGASRHNTICDMLTWAFREAMAGCYTARQAYDQLYEQFLAAKPDQTATEFDDLARWAAAQAQLDDPTDTFVRVYRNEISEQVTRLRVRDIAQRIYSSERARNQLDVNAERAVNGKTFLTDSVVNHALWGLDEQILWASGEGFMIAGPQGVGKSTVAQQLFLSRLGIGEPELFGFPIAPDHRPVLYLAMDRPAQIRRSLARMVDLSDESVAQVLQNNLVVWTGPVPFDAAESPKEFAAWVKLRGREPGLVVVDSLKDLATGLATDEVGSGLNEAMQRVLADGTEVVLLHHLRKANAQNPRPDKLDDIYGNAWLTAGLGSIILLWGQPGAKTVELRHLKQPQEAVGPLAVSHSHQAGQSVAADPIERLKELARNAGQDGFTHDEAIQALYSAERGDPTFASAKAKARRKLDQLKESGHLTYVPGGSGGAGGGGRPARWISRGE